MIRNKILLLIVLSTSVLFAQRPELNLNWSDFLSQHDIVYKRLPENYYEGAYVGNGLLGTILYRDNLKPNSIRFDIGRSDVYDHRSAEMLKGKYPSGKVRLPIGQLLLSPVGIISKTDLRIDLWNAEIRGTITTDKGKIELSCYVPSDERFIVLKLRNDKGEEAASLSFRPEQGNSSRPEIRINKSLIYEPNPPFVVEKIKGTEVATQPLLMGDDYATAWNEKKLSDGSRSVYITVANRWADKLSPGSGSAGDAVSVLHAARKKDEATVRKQHRDWWHNYYQASFVSFPDKRIESLYWIQQYRLGSAGHPGKPVIDLMGPWYLRSVWTAMWTNLNVQLAYYTTGISNHLEMEEPLFQLLERRKDQLVNNVLAAFRDDCAALGNPVGYDDLEASVGLYTDPNSKTKMSLIALPWLMQEYYIHYRMKMDDKLLRNSVYPLMRKAFAVYARTLYKGDDGSYHLPLSFSDEYGEDVDVSMNLALARWGFKTLIDCANRLKIDDPMLPRWKDLLENMTPYPVDERGLKIGKNLSFDRPHRHYSHLFSIFPLYESNIENRPDFIPIMKTSLRNFTGLAGDSCMFKFTGASSLWAALGDGNETLKWLNRSIQFVKKGPTFTPNGFYSENGWPTFESPVSACRAALDMYIQSWGNKIRVFPAIPDVWKDACFYNLRAEGGFLVSAKRTGGKTDFITITSEAGEPCLLKTDMENPVAVGNKNLKINKLSEHEYAVELKKGGTVTLINKGQNPALLIEPITSKFNTQQYFGIAE